MQSFKCLLLIFLFALMGTSASAFTATTTSGGKDIKWSSPNASFRINTSGGPTDSLSAIQAAMQTWTDVDTSPFTFSYGGETDSIAYGTDDGINIILFGAIDSAGTIARNFFWYNSWTGEMSDSDIKFNTNYTWSASGEAGKYDVQNVATHELGHSLSLADLYNDSDSEKTMYGYASTGETKQRSLDTDDINGITYLYPSATDAAPPTGSVSINSGAVYTKSASVTLSLSASDASGIKQMCLSNASACSSWQSYATSRSWTLSSGDGDRTVYVWFEDNVGNINSMPFSDSITLDTTAPVDGTLSADPGNGQIYLSWSGFADSLSGIQKYKLVYNTTGSPASCAGGVQIYSGTGSSYTHTGLNNGTTYYYRICAADNAGNDSVGATADAKPMSRYYTLKVNKTGSGTIISSPSGINCGIDCSEAYIEDSTVLLTATPSADYAFTGWSACNSTNSNQCTVKMNSGKTVTASFTACTFSISPDSATAGAEENSGSVAITASHQNCAWNAASNSAWITVTSGSGSGSGSVSYSASANTGVNSRTGTISINGMTFTLFQSAPEKMPLPTDQQSFSYAPVSDPENYADPAKAKPLGVGSSASGGSMVNIQTGLGEFDGQVDVYFAIYAPVLDPVNIYLLTSDYMLQTLATGFVPWKTNIAGPVVEQLFGEIPVTAFPAGTYYLGLLVSPAGNSADRYYFWVTSFEIPSP